MEQNATDNDVEVVFAATGGGAGLAEFQIVAPGDRTIVDFKAPDSKLGIREFLFESPEPKSDGSVQADFPEGEYTFTGKAVTGQRLESKVVLSHKLPTTTSLIHPAADAEGVPVNGLIIEWSPVKGVGGYVIVIEQDETGQEVTAKLDLAVHKFVVPDGFLQSGTEYTLGIGTVSFNDNNTSFIETSFTTAK